MKSINLLKNLLVRFRYPVSLPADIAEAFGTALPNTLPFKELLRRLSCPSFTPKRIRKYMSRSEAERAFAKSKRIEKFGNRTLCSFCFSEGWIEFMMIYDKDSHLRRLYLRHRQIPDDLGIEIHLLHSRDRVPVE